MSVKRIRIVLMVEWFCAFEWHMRARSHDIPSIYQHVRIMFGPARLISTILSLDYFSYSSHFLCAFSCLRILSFIHCHSPVHAASGHYTSPFTLMCRQLEQSLLLLQAGSHCCVPFSISFALCIRLYSVRVLFCTLFIATSPSDACQPVSFA